MANDHAAIHSWIGLAREGGGEVHGKYFSPEECRVNSLRRAMLPGREEQVRETPLEKARRKRSAKKLKQRAKNTTPVADGAATTELEAARNMEALLAELEEEEAAEARVKKAAAGRAKKQQAARTHAVNAAENVMVPQEEEVAAKGAAGEVGVQAEAVEEEEDCCPICILDFGPGDSLRVLDCWHKFHTECIEAWCKRSKTCPLCNAEIGA